jgi:hypothetical protein
LKRNEALRDSVIVFQCVQEPLVLLEKPAGRRAKLGRELENPVLTSIVIIDCKLVVEFGSAR